jgi:predicted aspartyl protease
MSLFRVSLVVADPRDAARVTPPIDALVDTGSELSWLPAPLLERVGIARLRKKTFKTASGQILVRDIGYAVLRAEGFETIDEVVFADPQDMTLLLGVRTIEGFAATVDPIAHRLAATTTIAA